MIPSIHKITKIESFAATIKRVGIVNRLVIVHQVWFQNYLNKLKDGEYVSVSISTRKPKRTIQQNRFYFGVYLPLIAEQTGEGDIERLHELFKGKFLTREIVEVLGEKVRIKKSTTELSIGEFCDYILAIESFTGIEAPPTENWDLDPLPNRKVASKILFL